MRSGGVRGYHSEMPSHDVFISYAHVDNETLLADHEGWISIFQRALEKRLSQLLGRPANVWWDRRRLSGNHYFDDTIAAGCEAATTMVSVVTPRYLKSEYCRHEVSHFARTHGLRFGDRSRLFTCVKTPVERAELFPEMAGKLGYPFFREDELGGRFREYDVYDPSLRPLFMAALEDLAQDLGQLVTDVDASAHRLSATALMIPRTEPPPAGSVAPTPGAAEPPAVVLVATTAGDVRGVRESVVRELTSRGTLVEPAEPWSEDATTFASELVHASREASVSVHILGKGYGVMPEDAEASYPELQLEHLKRVASERPPEMPLVRIVWVHPEAKEGHAKQQRLIERVREDRSLGPLDELLEGDEEELKARIEAKLHQLAEQRRKRLEEAREAAERKQRRQDGGVSSDALPAAVKKIYVISASDEDEQVEEVERSLGTHGFDVISSVELEEEETEALREARHQQWLRDCDGCLIYHGKSKVAWVRAQIDEVRKAVGHGRDARLSGRAVYVAPPIEGLKRRYQVQFPKLEGRDHPARDLEPFVRQLRDPAAAATADRGLGDAG